MGWVLPAPGCFLKIWRVSFSLDRVLGESGLGWFVTVAPGATAARCV